MNTYIKAYFYELVLKTKILLHVIQNSIKQILKIIELVVILSLNYAALHYA